MTEPGHDAQVIAHLQIEGFVAAELNDDVDYTISPEIHMRMYYTRQLAATAASSSIEGAMRCNFDIGCLLMGFLQRFGTTFDWDRDGVSIRRGGIVPKHHSWCVSGPGREGRLALEDPQVGFPLSYLSSSVRVKFL